MFLLQDLNNTKIKTKNKTKSFNYQQIECP